MPSWLHTVYQLFLALLAIITIWLITLPDEPWVYQANLAIWVIFLTDYLVRLALAPKRRPFVRHNLADLVAVVPVDYLAEILLSQDVFGAGRLVRLARFVRLVRLMRAGAVLWRLAHDVRGVLRTNGLGYVLAVTGCLIVMGGVAVWLVEPDIGTVGDGVWWSIVTATTVGYGDISPTTGIGRTVAGILMIAGIGTISMITGSVATYFIGQKRCSDSLVQHVISELERWDDLQPAQRKQAADLLKRLAEGQG